MRYHYEKPRSYSRMYGKTVVCNHPVYNSCTIFRIENKGLAIIQQRYNPVSKCTWWSEIDPWLNDELYLHPCFKTYFEERSGELQNGLYPTVTIRQIMWALKMKPLPRQRWETCFDRRDI